MLSWLKSLFTQQDADDPDPDFVSHAMEKMDHHNSIDRLRKLNLSAEQLRVVKGLLAGTLAPDECLGVNEWCAAEEVSSTGVDALAYALQMALKSDAITYVFPSGQKFPAAMLPKFVQRSELAIVVSHVGGTPVFVASLDEFLTSNGIVDYSLEILSPSSLRRRLSGEPGFKRDRLDRGATPSVTILKLADDQQRLLEPFEMTDLVDAIHQELGYNLTPDELAIEAGPIEQLGLFTCVAQIDSITQKKIKFWVMPKVTVDS